MGHPRGGNPLATLGQDSQAEIRRRRALAQVTDAQRIGRIKQLLNELNKIPPEKHEVVLLPGMGPEPRHCQVISIRVDEVLLNHRSHRVRAQLEDDPDWQELKADPHSERAQKLIERHVRAARTPERFAALKESLQREGQTHPGVITHKGVLVNANTRAVALRELEDPTDQYIRAAVLPETIQPDQLALLELRLQMQKDLKVDYSLTNELLFIEELSSERQLTDAQIARELRINPENVKKGETEVQTRLQLLDLIRLLQRLPTDPLPLTFFDSLSYEQLRDLHRSYYAAVQDDPDQAQGLLESFVLSVAVGVTNVHSLRRVDAEFISDYMVPQLEEDEIAGAFTASIVKGSPTPGGAMPRGVDALLTADDEEPGQSLHLGNLIDVVTQKDRRVKIEGSRIRLQRDDVKDAVRSAVITGVKEKRRDENEAKKLRTPADTLKEATKQLKRCAEACRTLLDDVEFDDKRRKTLEAAFKKLKRTYRSLESELIKNNVIGG